MSSTDQTVYVLQYSQEHGDDISVYATEELAAISAAKIARQYWSNATGSVNAPDSMPATPDGLSDEEVTAQYFEAMGGQEWYEITVKPVNGS